MNDVQKLLTDLEAGILQLIDGLEDALKSKSISKQHSQVAAIAAINEFLSKVGIEPRLRDPLVSIASDIVNQAQADSRKPLDESLKGAAAAAAIHLLILNGDKLSEASAAVSKAMGGALTSQQLIELRKNISKGRARAEAKDWYHHMIQQWTDPQSLEATLPPRYKRVALLSMVSKIYGLPNKG